jgi:hypothetical protein
MHSRLVIGCICGSILLIGLALGGLLGGRMPALASQGSTSAAAAATAATAAATASTTPTDSQKYCQAYIQNLAAALKVSVGQLEAANLTALQKTIRQAYADGKITQAQETKLLDRAARFSKDPCGALRHDAGSHPRKGSIGHSVAYALTSDRPFAVGVPYAV